MKIKKTRENSLFDIEGDKELFIKIAEDMLKEAGPHSPSTNRNLGLGGHDGGKYFKDNRLL